MTVGSNIENMIRQMIFHTVYSSAAGPDVFNRALTLDPDPGLAQAIDKELESGSAAKSERKKKAEGGDGEFENALANEINDSFNAEADAAMSDKEYEAFYSEKSEGMFEGFGETQASGMVKQGIGVAKNPMSVLAPLISILPHAALVALAIALAPMIIDEMKKPGSMLDVRWRRIMQDEFNALMNRQDQWNAQIGLRQVYTTSHDSFLIQNGAAMSESNLKRVRESDQRIADRLEFTDHAKELFR